MQGDKQKYGRPVKQVILSMACLSFVGLAVSCKSTGNNSATEPKYVGTAAVERDKAKTETKEAAQAMQDYAYAEKARFVDEMKRELGEIQKELDRLSAKVERSSGTVKVDAKAKLAVVRDQWAQAKETLDRAESAGESSWDDMKSGFQKSYDLLKSSFDQTRQWLSEKIAP